MMDNDGEWRRLRRGKSSPRPAAAPTRLRRAPRAVPRRTDGDGVLALQLAAPGDIDLNGMVDILDVSALLAADRFNSNSGSAASWSEGDFNADGSFDILDVGELINANVFDRGPYETAGSVVAAAAVPEPGIPAAVAVSAFAVAWRARRGLIRAVGG